MPEKWPFSPSNVMDTCDVPQAGNTRVDNGGSDDEAANAAIANETIKSASSRIG